jgi:hypothetical protein
VVRNCNAKETLVHLFWACPFADQCWNFVCPQRNKRLSILEALEEIKTRIKLPFAMEIITLAAWGIWMIRNNKIFKDQIVFISWKVVYSQELKLLVHRMKKKHIALFKDWIQSHL